MAPDLRRSDRSRALPAELAPGTATDPDPRPTGARAPVAEQRLAGSAAPTPEPRLAAADRVRFAAFEAGLLGIAAASFYSLTLLLLRAATGAAVLGAGCCALLLVALAAAARDPAVAFVVLQRRSRAVPVLGALAGVALAAIGPDNRLLFLPALLLVATLGMTAGPRRTLVASALASAGLLAPLLLDSAAIGDRRLLALTATGLLAIPALLTALVARAGGPTRLAAHADRHAAPVAAAHTAPVAAAHTAPVAAAHTAPVAAAHTAPVAAAHTAPVAAAHAAPVAAAAHATPAATPPNTTGPVSSSDVKPVLIPSEAQTRPPAAVASPLTPRQLEAVALTAAGLRHAEIAERLGVSIHQVRRLLRQGRERVDASTTRELVAWAMMRGILGPETETRPSND